MKRWLLMGAAVLALVLAVSLGQRSPAPAPGSGDKILTAAGDPITRDELEEARRSARALWDLGGGSVGAGRPGTAGPDSPGTSAGGGV